MRHKLSKDLIRKQISNLAKNPGLKLASLGLAFLIWIVVSDIDNPTKSALFSDVKVQVVNEDSVTAIDKLFDIISDDTVVIKVTERESILNRLSRDDFSVVADMENLTDMNTVPLTVTCSNRAVTWDEIEIMPSKIKVKLEQMKQSEFVINVITSGEPVKGYEVGKTEVVQGKTVQIAGSESMLNRIGQVTANINVGRIRTDKRLTAQLIIYDKDGVAFTDAQMSRLQIKDSDGVLLSDQTVMVDVSVWAIMNDIPVEVPISGTPADGYRMVGKSIIPATVNVVGTKEALAKLNGKIVLKDELSLDGADKSFTQEFDISNTLAEIDELRLVAGADPTVTVSVQIEQSGDITVNIPLSELKVLNRPDNMTLTFSPADAISVVVHNEHSGYITIENSDIKASIDLGVCVTPGTYEIPIEIELPEGFALSYDVVLVVTSEESVQPSEESVDKGE